MRHGVRICGCFLALLVLGGCSGGDELARGPESVDVAAPVDAPDAKPAGPDAKPSADVVAQDLAADTAAADQLGDAAADVADAAPDAGMDAGDAAKADVAADAAAPVDAAVDAIAPVDAVVDAAAPMDAAAPVDAVPAVDAKAEADAPLPPDLCAGVTCPAFLCATQACDPATGQCVATAKAAGTACEDGDACTSPDTCSGGICMAGPAPSCDDANACTNDACLPTTGCQHAASAGPCDDGNACTLADTCSASVCLAGAATVNCDDNDPCTNDVCDAKTGACGHVANAAPCDDGNACTLGDSCGALGCSGNLDCTCALAAGQTPATVEDCDTPFDDNCDGKVNESAVCGATQYKFAAIPECAFTCYYDEAHDIAVSGDAANPAGFDVYATGQLFDGIKGVDDWAADTGKGAAFEWVAWSTAQPMVTVQFPKPRYVTLVRIGLDNWQGGAVVQPPGIRVRVSLDGLAWSAPQVFTLADQTMPAIAAGKRGDVTLPLALQVAKYVEISFLSPGTWTFVDELAFD